MAANSIQLSLATHAMAYMLLGLCLGVRITSGISPNLRNRLAILAAFGIFQGLREWIQLSTPQDQTLLLAAQSLGFFALVSLYAFALGSTPARLKLTLACCATATLLLATLAITHTVPLHSPLVRLAIAIPAALLAGWTLLRDPSFRTNSRWSRYTARLTAACFVFYGFLLLWSPHDTLFTTSLLSAASFQHMFGVSNGAARTVTLLSVAIGLLVLLNQLQDEETRTAESRTTQSRADLEASEARLRTILQSEPACVKLIGPDCTLHDMNPAGLRMIGVEDLNEVLGKSVLPLIRPEYHHAYLDAVSRVFSGETTFVQYEIESRDGTHRWLEQNAAPIFDPARPGRVMEMIGVTRDVTERMMVEKSERIAKERLELAQRIAKVGSWEWDLRTNALTWSDECFRVLGWEITGEQPTLARFMASCHPEDRAILEASIQRGMLSKSASEYEHRIIWPNGQVRVIHQLFQVEHDANGKPVLMIGTTQDVTDFRMIETELRQSQTTLSGILTISPEAIIVTDAQGNISLFSAGAETIFGCKAVDVIGRQVSQLIPERYRANHSVQFNNLASSGTVSRPMGTRSTITGLRRNGEEFPAEASLSKLESPSGPLFTTILRDMTQEHASRMELLESKLRSEEANIAKSRFLANMSHELRTPLNAIIGFSDMLQGGMAGTDEKRREYAADINSSGRHLLKVINDILDISRIEAGKMTLAEEIIDVTEIVDSCLRMVATRAAEAGVDIETTVEPGLPGILADRRLVLQVLLNLLSNAVKFSHAGGRVAVRIAHDPDGKLVVDVRDNGIGMSAEDVLRVGEPFLQVDGRLERKYEGTGLGLVIAKRMMELHGGEIRVHSALGTGTTMSAVFPTSRVRPAPLTHAKPKLDQQSRRSRP